MRKVDFFAPFNDSSGGTLGKIMEANNRRKAKAKLDMEYRDKHAEVLEVVLLHISHYENRKKQMQIAQALTDELMPIVMGGK